MNQLIRLLTIAAVILAFLFSYSLLEIVGWKSLEGASSVTKVHPSTYLFTLAAILGLVSNMKRYRQTLIWPPLLFFLVAAIILTVRAIMITLAGTTEGELSTALVTWISPAMMLICFQSLDRPTLDKMAIGLRLFFVVNSAIGLAEALLHFHLIRDLNMFAEFDNRSSGLCGHPLSASMLTGIMIVYLVATRKQDRFAALRLAEIGLHAAAMFAFGGRAAMVFTPAVLAVSLFLNFSRQGDAKPSALQRILPVLLIGAGVALIMLPIPFVDQALERFTNDQGSAETRNAAFHIVGMLDPKELLAGVDADRRHLLTDFFHTPAGIEISWLAMIVTYGLVATLPMIFALPVLLLSVARPLDRSAFYMVIFVLLATAASLSFGTKTLLITQLLVMMRSLALRDAPDQRARQSTPQSNRADSLFSALR